MASKPTWTMIAKLFCNGLLTNYSVKLTQLYELCQNQNINLEKVEKLVFELTMIDVLECLIES